MPRTARQNVLYDGCYAHVLSRSIRKLRIFRDDEDFREIVRLIKYTKNQAGFNIYHYCFMQTHFHLVVSIPRVEDFSRAMGYIKGQYSYKFHTKYRLSGPIWRERYRGLLIEDDHYLRACGEYIENNPVKAGLVAKAGLWKYSSARYYKDGEEDELVDMQGQPNRVWKRVQVDLEEERFFERGKVIGSPFFRYQYYERHRRK